MCNYAPAFDAKSPRYFLAVAHRQPVHRYLDYVGDYLTKSDAYREIENKTQPQTQEN